MPHVIDSMELAQVLAEAEDIARNVNQKLTSAHQLLAFFTVPNRAEMLLKERGVDEDRILLALTGAPREPEGVERDLRERAREVAEGVGAEEVDCLHLLIAMSRVRQSCAYQLLGDCGLQLPALRNVALSYFTARMPRRLRQVQPARAPSPGAPGARRAAPQEEPLVAGDLDLPDREPATGVPPPAPPAASAPTGGLASARPARPPPAPSPRTLSTRRSSPGFPSWRATSPSSPRRGSWTRSWAASARWRRPSTS